MGFECERQLPVLAGHSAFITSPTHSLSRIKSEPISCFTPSATLICTHTHTNGPSHSMKVNKYLPSDHSCFTPRGRRMLARTLHPFHMHPTNRPSVHTHRCHLQRARSHPLHMHVPCVAPCVHHLGIFTCVVEGQAPPGTSKKCQEWLMTRGSSKQGAETVLLSVTCDHGCSAGK